MLEGRLCCCLVGGLLVATVGRAGALRRWRGIFGKEDSALLTDVNRSQ